MSAVRCVLLGLVAAGLAGAVSVSGQSHVLTGTEGRVEHLKPTDHEWVRVVGAYEVRVCRRGSDCADDASRDALQRSFVSIQPDSIELAAVDPLTRSMLAVGSAGHPPQNACYIVEQLLHQSGNSAGIANVGLFAVEPEVGNPTLKLYLGASTDAYYQVDASIVNGRLEGVGRSIMVGNITDVPIDTVVGWHTGPPDAARCIAAGKTLAGSVRHTAGSSVPPPPPPRPANLPLVASDHNPLPARLGSWVRAGRISTVGGASNTDYVSGDARVDVSIARRRAGDADALSRAALKFKSSFDSVSTRRAFDMPDTVTAKGVHYTGVTVAVVRRGQGDVALCLFYAFALGDVLMTESVTVPASQIATTDAPLFAHELARQVVRAGKS